MPVFLSPQVITREIDLSAFAQGVASNITLVVGASEKGRTDEPVFVATPDSFIRGFGEPDPSAVGNVPTYASYASLNFLEFGRQLYFQRIDTSDIIPAVSLMPLPLSVDFNPALAEPARFNVNYSTTQWIQFTMLGEGSWGGNFYAEMVLEKGQFDQQAAFTASTVFEFTLNLWEVDTENVARLVETHNNLTAAQIELVVENSRYVSAAIVSSFSAPTAAALAVEQEANSLRDFRLNSPFGWIWSGLFDVDAGNTVLDNEYGFSATTAPQRTTFTGTQQEPFDIVVGVNDGVTITEYQADKPLTVVALVLTPGLGLTSAAIAAEIDSALAAGYTATDVGGAIVINAVTPTVSRTSFKISVDTANETLGFLQAFGYDSPGRVFTNLDPASLFTVRVDSDGVQASLLTPTAGPYAMPVGGGTDNLLDLTVTANAVTTGPFTVTLTSGAAVAATVVAADINAEFVTQSVDTLFEALEDPVGLGVFIRSKNGGSDKSVTVHITGTANAALGFGIVTDTASTGQDSEFTVAQGTTSLTGQYDSTFISLGSVGNDFVYGFETPDDQGAADGYNRPDSLYTTTGVVPLTDGQIVSAILAKLNESPADKELLIYNLLAIPGNMGITNATLVQAIHAEAIAIAETRQDILVLLDPPSNISTSQGFTDWRNTYLSSSSYAATYAPWVKIFDRFNDCTLLLPPSFSIVAVMAFNDSVSEPWFAPAGLNRGRMFRVLDVAEKFYQGDRDLIYSNQINPLVVFSGEGAVVWGQKTLQRANTARNRINVRRLLNYAKAVTEQAVRQFMFEPHDPRTWRRVEDVLNPLFEDIRRRRGLVEFKVVVDATINTPELIEQSILCVQVFLKPTKAIEGIKVDFVIVRQDADLASAASLI